MRNLLALFVFCIVLGTIQLEAACKLRKEKGARGAQHIILENEFLKLRLTPDKGGQCTGIVVKEKGKEIEDFVVNLFDDMDWSKSFKDQPFSNTPYSFKILQNSKDKLRVLLEARGTKDYAFFIIRKTFTLNAGERVFKTDYEVHNLAESMGAYTFKLWCHNGLYAKKMNAVYYWSSPSGIYKMPYPGKMSNWEYQSPRGWSGVVNKPSSSGIACVVNYSEIIALYNWFGSHSANMEWRYMPVRIKNGESFTTTVYTLLFAGLPRLDYACKDGAFAWDTSKSSQGNAALEVAAAEKKELNIRFEFRKTTDEKWEKLCAKKISAFPEKIEKIQIPLPKLEDGRYVLRALMNIGSSKNIFEKVFAVGPAKDKGEYVYKPVEKKKDFLKEKKYFPYKLSGKFVTPCVKWFKPLPGKKIKAFFIKDWMNTRPVLELAERLSLDYDVPTIMKSGYCFSGFVPPRSDSISSHVDGKPYLKALEKELINEKSNVIIIDDRPLWKDLTAKARETALEKVRNGTSLMIVAEQLRKTTDKELKELFKGAQDVKGMKGYKRKELSPDGARLVVFPDGRSRCFLSHDFGWLLLWAARREPTSDLKIDLSNSGKINQRELNKNGILLQFAPPKEEGALEVEKVLTKKKGWENLEIVWRETQKVGNNKATLTFPHFPAGKYQLSLILRENGNAINSIVKDIEILSPLKVKDIKLEKDILKPGEAASGKVSILNEGDKPLTGEGLIEFSDNWGRLIGKKKFNFNLNAKKEQSEEFSFRQNNPLSVIHNIKVSLEVNGKIYVAQAKEVTYPGFNFQDDDYLAFTWSAPGICWGRGYAREILRDYCGFNLEQTHDGKSASMRNQKYFPHNVMGNAYNDWQNCKTLGVRKHCLSEKKTLDDVAKNVNRVADNSARYGAFAINLADEASLTHWETPSELCGSPACMKKYYKWLKKKYKTVDVLNKEWGTNFKSWKDAKPMTEAEAKDRTNLAQWSDFREHMENVWTDFMKDMKKIKDEKTPQSRFSICGVQGGHPYSGYNWWKLRDVFDFVMPYTSTALLRSFNPKGKFGKYTGYRIDPAQQIKDSWKFFFDNQFVFSYFLSTYPVLPDLSIAHTYADPIKEVTDRFGRGIGKAFIKTKRQGDKIAIHYSQSSIRMNYMQKYREKEINDFIKFYRAARADYEDVLKDMGYDPLYISYEEIENGKLTPQNYKMFIMPVSTALSRKETEAIKKYVADGGIVIADCLTGLYDENGKPNATGCLDELFGVKREKMTKDRLSFQRCKINGCDKNILLCQEAGVVPNGAEPLLKLDSDSKTEIDGYTVSEPSQGGGLAYMKSTGKGKTVYLAFVSDYVKNPSQTSAVANVYRKVLNEVGFPKAEVKVKDSKGKPVLCQVLRHRRDGGKSLLLGLLRRETLPLEEKPYTVELPDEACIYDMLKGKYLKKGKSFKIKLTPGIGRLFAVLPYKVEDMAIKAPAKVACGNKLPLEINIETNGATNPEYHVIRMEVIEPDGKTAKYYTKNFEAPGGKLKTSLDIAMNAPQGKWTIKTRDALTGIEKEKSFEVTR